LSYAPFALEIEKRGFEEDIISVTQGKLPASAWPELKASGASVTSSKYLGHKRPDECRDAG
jgi:hypothetical protein